MVGATTVGAAAVFMTVVFAPAPFELPAPTGQYPVGTTTWLLTDTSRPETFTGGGDVRQIEVHAWYPAASPSSGATAPYLRDSLQEVQTLATQTKAPGVFDQLAAVTTHAHLDAKIAAGQSKLPLLVFSHGYTGFPSSHTTLLEDLASHGYIVLSVVHSYEAGGATLAAGRVVTTLDANGALRQPIQDLLAEWRLEDETMANVTKAAGDAEQLRLMRGYLSTLPRTDAALKRWVDDTRLVLDRLPSLRAGVGAQLAARADMTRIGVLGHTMGGVTAGQFCVEDRRCRAGLNLDGIPQYGPMIDTPLKSPFLMVYSARPGRAGASDIIYRTAPKYYRVDVQDTRHLDFCDMNFWGGPLKAAGGPIAPARAAEITRTIVREYFDQELMGKRSGLLAGERRFPEVSVTLPRSRKP
jgi:dienelactone hydrolase